MSFSYRRSLALLVLSCAALPAFSASAAPIDYDPWCPEGTRAQDPSTQFELKETHVGGAWWLLRETELGSLLAIPEALRLLDGSGQSVELNFLARPSALAILVPTDAMVGDSFLLESDLSRDSLVLRVVEDEGLHSPFSVHDQTPTVVGPEGECDVYCFSEGYTVPRAPALDLVYSGGPVAVTIEYSTGLGPGRVGTPEAIVVDAYLEHSPAPRSVSFVVGQDTLEAEAWGQARVIYTPVHAPYEEWEQNVTFDPLEEVPFEQPEGVTRCDEMPSQRGRSFPMGCDSAKGSGADASLLLATLGGLLFIRRARSGGQSC